MNSKDGQRKILRERLSHLSSEEIHQQSLKLSQNLDEFLSKKISAINGSFHNEARDSLCLAAFSPILKEPIWFLSLRECYKEFALPHLENDKEMSFYLCKRERIEVGNIGLKLPDILRGKAEEKKSVTPDIILIPGLGFDSSFNRLGRGKGYYDRYLAVTNALRVGLFFDCQRLESVVTDEYDKKLDYIITENQILGEI